MKRLGSTPAVTSILVSVLFLGACTSEPRTVAMNDEELRELRREVASLKRQVDRMPLLYQIEPDDIPILEQQVRAAEEIQRHVQAMLGAGVGGIDQLYSAKLDLARARSRLSMANGNTDDSLQHLDDAVKAAESHQAAIKNRYEAGQTNLEFVLRSLQVVGETKLQRNRIQRRFASESEKDSRTDVGMHPERIGY